MTEWMDPERYYKRIRKVYNSPYICGFPFDANTAIYLVTLCYQAYVLNKKGKFTHPTWPCSLKVLQVLKGPILKTEEDVGMILESPDAYYIVFRGTRSVGESLVDLWSTLTSNDLITDVDGGKVHRGFYYQYTTPTGLGSLQQQVKSILPRLSPHKKLYITGHSLGAALATICALDVAKNSKFKQPLVYTFGSPRVGDEAFVKKFNQTIHTSWRVENESDRIRRLPPSDFGYRHVDTLFPLDVHAGNPLANHDIATAYFPGLSSFSPSFAADLCINNPDFCPKSLIPPVLQPILTHFL